MILKFVKSLAVLSLLICPFVIFSQTPTIGLRSNLGGGSEGYTLFSPEKDTTVYLIDQCGQIVNDWGFSEKPGATCYLLENGNLLRAGKDSLEIRDWDNNLIWSYAMNVNGYLQHHDIEPLPNGNILCLLTDRYTDVEMIPQGRDSSQLAANFKLDKLVELQPVGNNDANLIWEWKFIDHMIQDYDSTKLNYGSIINHPELLDLNYENDEISDYTHVNGIDYNSSLDHILISARHLNEIYIIDHSTTTLEAAGHSGGNSNKGGDFLWRWGNSEVYTQDSNDVQKLFVQHDAKWVESGKLDADKVSVFNNGGDISGSFSAVHLIQPVVSNGSYDIQNSRFLPLTYDYTWMGTILGDTLREGRKSGVESLDNGNMLICESSKGQITEVEKLTGNVVWVFLNPIGSQLYSQGSIIPVQDNSIFRAQRYGFLFSGFSGKDLSPKGIIEDVNSLSSICVSLSAEESYLNHIRITNPVQEFIDFNTEIEADVSIYGLGGQLLFSHKNYKGHLLYTRLPQGLYTIVIRSNGETYREKLIFE
jgi:hypothetical protein